MFLKRSPTVAPVQSPSLTQVSVATETEKEQCDAIAHWPKVRLHNSKEAE